MVTFAKIFLTLKFGYVSFFFPTPPIKLKLGLQIGGETTYYTNCEPPGRIILIGQSETGNSSQVLFITLFLRQVFRLCCAIIYHHPQQTVQKSCAKIILLNQRGMNDFNFSSSNFNLQEGHILKHWRSEGNLYNAQREGALLVPVIYHIQCALF